MGSQRKIVECVPNFSEGKDRQIIDAIASAIKTTTGVSLLDVDAGASTNRTVYTFVGSPEAVVEGALAGARVAAQLIDMSKHKGEHKRLGALDVCPFIPVSGVTMDDCICCAHLFASRLADELHVPVFLYGFASKQEYRKEVPQIRAGEYEALEGRLKDPKWAPDYGPTNFVPRWGGTIVGARKFLIAYNVNLIATKEQAHRIALAIRATKPNGQPGRLPATQAMGWYLAEANIAQVTVNILDYEQTGVHTVYEEVLKEAAALRLPVTGSEVVGLVPLQAMLDVAAFYTTRELLFVLEENQKIHLAVSRLGLSSLAPFEPSKRIIEYMTREDDQSKLVNQTVARFTQMVADRTAAPGGGTVGACVGALGCGLAAMVGKLSYGKKAFEATDSLMRQLIPPLHNTVDRLLALADEDTNAFTEYGLALKLPDKTEAERATREMAIETGLRKAISVPLSLMENVSKLWPVLERLVPVYHRPTTSDLQVAVQCLRTAVHAGAYNVRINLKLKETVHLREEITSKVEAYIRVAEEQSAKLLNAIAENDV